MGTRNSLILCAHRSECLLLSSLRIEDSPAIDAEKEATMSVAATIALVWFALLIGSLAGALAAGLGRIAAGTDLMDERAMRAARSHSIELESDRVT